jgi:hypothetical protein
MLQQYCMLTLMENNKGIVCLLEIEMLLDKLHISSEPLTISDVAGFPRKTAYHEKGNNNSE